MKSKFVSMLFVAMLAVSVTAMAADVTTSVSTVKDRVTLAHGSQVAVAVQDAAIGYGLTSRTVSNITRTEADVDYSVTEFGVKATGGVGYVAETSVKSHPVYFASLGYDYALTDALKAGVSAGFKNDFSQAIRDRQVTESAHVSYALTKTTGVNAAFTRYNGDVKLNAITVACITKF